MFRLLIVIACCAVPVFSNSAGAPQAICANGLVPEHHVDPQESPVPYRFSGAGAVRGGDKLALTLGGDDFLGFAVQAQDAHKNPVGQFKIVESNKSQTLTCSAAGDTLTHKKINRDNPIKSVEFEWIAPKGYKGKVRLVATVAKNGGTYWVRKVQKDINVQ